MEWTIRKNESIRGRSDALENERFVRVNGAHQPLATPDNVVACYRIILNRKPDEPGLRHFLHLIRGGIPLGDLGALFTGSTEASMLNASRQSQNREIITIKLDGFSLDVMPGWNAVHNEIAQTGAYEPHVVRHLSSLVKPEMVFVDIGANLGFYSVLAASKGAKVHAFEPNPRNVWFIKRNADRNSINIDIHPVALADAARFLLYSPIDGNGQIHEMGEDFPSADQQIIKASTLDFELADEKVDIIKIDIEGAEGIAMAGAARALQSKPKVFSEFSAAGIESVSRMAAADYLSMFTSRGYQFDICQRDGSLQRIDAVALERASRENVSGLVDFIAS